MFGQAATNPFSQNITDVAGGFNKGFQGAKQNQMMGLQVENMQAEQSAQAEAATRSAKARQMWEEMAKTGDTSRSLEAAALSPEYSKQMLEHVGIDDKRKALFNAKSYQATNQFLKNGDRQGAIDYLQRHAAQIDQRGGNSQDTRELLQKIASGDDNSALSHIRAGAAALEGSGYVNKGFTSMMDMLNAKEQHGVDMDLRKQGFAEQAHTDSLDLSRDKMAQDQDQFNRGMGYKYSKLNQDNNQFNQQLAMSKEKLDVEQRKLQSAKRTLKPAQLKMLNGYEDKIKAISESRITLDKITGFASSKKLNDDGTYDYDFDDVALSKWENPVNYAKSFSANTKEHEFSKVLEKVRNLSALEMKEMLGPGPMTDSDLLFLLRSVDQDPSTMNNKQLNKYVKGYQKLLDRSQKNYARRAKNVLSGEYKMSKEMEGILSGSVDVEKQSTDDLLNSL